MQHPCNLIILFLFLGVFSFLSYRDPNLLKTLDVYDGTGDFLRELEIDDDTLTKAIIGTIGDVDSYQLPDAKGYSRYEYAIIDSLIPVEIVFYEILVLLLNYQRLLQLSLLFFLYLQVMPTFHFICSLLRHLLGITEEERQRRREEILSTR